jgi:DNA-binding response OmpR family regulator
MTKSGKGVLIIDDEKNMRHMLQVMLNKEGYFTDEAADGRAFQDGREGFRLHTL